MDFYIRPAKPADAEDFWRMRTARGVFETILGNPGEGPQKSQTWLNNPGPGTYLMVAVLREEHSEKVIGTVSLSVPQNPRTAHCGGIGIMVDQAYQHQGVGRALMEAIIDLADNWLMLLRLELTAFADNQRAVALYEKMGFQREGLKKMAAVRDGKYMDELMMSRINQNFFP